MLVLWNRLMAVLKAPKLQKGRSELTKIIIESQEKGRKREVVNFIIGRNEILPSSFPTRVEIRYL